MAAADKHVLETPILLWAALLSCAISNSANALPAAEDVSRLAETTRLTTESFMQKSLKLRIGYEYSEKFLKQDDKAKLRKLAMAAGNQLTEIIKKQEQLKQQIEDYPGDDWDTRYGSTGLWRKLSNNIYIAALSKCEIDLHLALACEQSQSNIILHDILNQIDLISQLRDTAYAHLVKAKTLVLLAQTSPSHKLLAKKEVGLVLDREDINCSLVFRAEMEKTKLLWPTDPDQIMSMAQSIARSGCSDDLELVLSLASLAHRLNQSEAFEKIVLTWPQIQDFVGSLALMDLCNRLENGQLTEQSTPQISIFEAELAAQAAWTNSASEHKALLDRLANIEKFQTPLVMYVTAAAFAEASPAKAISLLIKASKSQQLQKNTRLQISAEKIASQAAQLAYNWFVEDSNNCGLNLRAFENYCTVANDKADEELEYLYSILLNACGRSEKGEKLLHKIANRPSGKRRNQARLDLIIQSIKQDERPDQNQRTKQLRQLTELIADCPRQHQSNDPLRTRAITIYCQLLLESKDKDSAQKVVNILTGGEITSDPNLNIHKSKALRQLGRLPESARCLLNALDTGGCEQAAEATELLSQIVEEIDRLQEQAEDFMQMVQNCEMLARYCYDCTGGFRRRQAGLIRAEIGVLAADKDKEKLSQLQEFLHNLVPNGPDSEPDLLRCQARLLTAQGNFKEAARLWKRICEIQKDRPPSPNRRNRKWWRAKYYELHCWAQLPQTRKADVLHSIEVIQNSFTHIPPPWAGKLDDLKQNAASGPAGAHN